MLYTQEVMQPYHRLNFFTFEPYLNLLLLADTQIDFQTDREMCGWLYGWIDGLDIEADGQTYG